MLKDERVCDCEINVCQRKTRTARREPAPKSGHCLRTPLVVSARRGRNRGLPVPPSSQPV